MNTDTRSRTAENRKYPTLLHILTSLFALLYLVFIVANIIQPGNNNLYEPENIIVNMAFIIFLVGYYFTWKNELIAGIIFIFWWGVMWYLGLFIVEQDKGAGAVMGIPVFIFGILFMVSWNKKKISSNTSINLTKDEKHIP
jgi:hypothetical protein